MESLLNAVWMDSFDEMIITFTQDPHIRCSVSSPVDFEDILAEKSIAHLKRSHSVHLSEFQLS